LSSEQCATRGRSEATQIREDSAWPEAERLVTAQAVDSTAGCERRRPRRAVREPRWWLTGHRWAERPAGAWELPL